MRPPLAAGLGLLLLAAFMPASGAAAAPAKSCGLRIVIGDHDSFRQAGHRIAPARFAAVIALTRQRLDAAARRLCAARILRPADLARIRRLYVQNGEGATEPLIYRMEEAAPDIFVFQYAFGEGEPPAPAEVERALRCWKRPKSAGCEIGD